MEENRHIWEVSPSLVQIESNLFEALFSAWIWTFSREALFCLYLDIMNLLLLHFFLLEKSFPLISKKTGGGGVKAILTMSKYEQIFS